MLIKVAKFTHERNQLEIGLELAKDVLPKDHIKRLSM